MISNQIQCEDEPIHLVERVQYFGKLMVLDTNNNIVGISDNFQDWFHAKPQSYLSKPFSYLQEKNIQYDWRIVNTLLQDTMSSTAATDPVETLIGEEWYSIRTYRQDNYRYLEFEAKKQEKAPIAKLAGYAKSMNAAGDDLWTRLCQQIREVIGFDRVMVYQFLEDKSGQVVAESVAKGRSSFLGYRYPEFDIPAQARALYLTHHARQVADIDAETFVLHKAQTGAIDLRGSNLRALSPIHLQYLKNAKAAASASFSILFEGKLWGLITCQHTTAQHTDSDQRNLIQFLIEFAVNKFTAVLHARMHEVDKKMAALELHLKENLLLKSNALTGLSVILPQLAKLLDADAVAVVHKERNILYHADMDSAELNRLHNYVNTVTDKQLFKDHNFTINHQPLIKQQLPFAGLFRIDFDITRTFCIYAFRKAVRIEEKWAGKPEKLMHYDSEADIHIPSPRTSFDAWHREVRGTALRWTEENVGILKRVRQVVRESILQKSDELGNLNQELIQLNNTLETYSYTVTHDLKNPLSAIKLAGQFMQQRVKDNELVQKGSMNILNAVKNMEAMMERILEFSKAKVYQFSPEWIEVHGIIKSISEITAERFKVPYTCVDIGNTLPVYGEKSLLYQLFSNIIGNAIKYSSTQVLPQISIRSSVLHDAIIYTIADNGIGIDKNELDKVYDVFRRMSNADSFEGSGVGMAIVKRILDRLNGTIRIESTLGEGTTVTISFPNAQIPQDMLPGDQMVG